MEPRGRDFSTLVVIGEDLMLYGGRSFNAGDEDAQDESNSVYDENVWVIKGLFSGLGKGETEEDFESMQKYAEGNCVWKALNGKGKNMGDVEVDDSNVSKSLIPTARRSHMVFVRNDNMYLTGGVDKDDVHHNDIWRFDLKNEIWEKVQNYSSNRPVARRRGTCLWNKNLDMMFQICGTRLPQNPKEIAWIETERLSEQYDLGDNNKEKLSSKILLEVDDFSVFAFDASLKNIATLALLKTVENEIEHKKLLNHQLEFPKLNSTSSTQEFQKKNTSNTTVSSVLNTISHSTLFCDENRFKILLNSEILGDERGGQKKSDRNNQIG